MDDEITIEPDVVDNLRPLRRSGRKSNMEFDSDKSSTDYGKHYNSTNRWILIVFAIIVVLLVGIIIFLIVYKDKEKFDRESDPNKGKPQNSQQHIYPQQRHSHKYGPPGPPGPPGNSGPSDPYLQQGSYQPPYDTRTHDQMRYSSSPANTPYQPTSQNNSEAVHSSVESNVDNKSHEGDEDLSDMVRRLSSSDSQEEMRRQLIKDIKGSDT